jgi:hypothetical protein
MIIWLSAGCSVTPLSTHVDKDRPITVSLIRLLTRPEDYHNKFVRVEGYMHKKFENSAIYISKETADYLINDCALWVSYGDKELALEPDTEKGVLYFDGKYVLIEGIFDREKKGHLGAYPGEIREINRIMELKRYYDGEKASK